LEVPLTDIPEMISGPPESPWKPIKIVAQIKRNQKLLEYYKFYIACSFATSCASTDDTICDYRTAIG